ncbi:flagellar protein FliS [Oxalobacteraceae bacterium GrIS 1.11]
MFGSRQNGINAYAKVGIETGVVSASPHKLIVMLFDGALAALGAALTHMRAGHIAEKGKAISHAILIVESGLRASLDKSVGGEIAESLDALYEYISARLLMANLKNQPELLEEAQRLLTELRDAWNAIGSVPAAVAPDQSQPRPPILARA